MGKYLIFLGSMLLAIGLLLHLKPPSSQISKEEFSTLSKKQIPEAESKQFTAFSWFGNLPGDIYYKSEQTTIYAPLMSMLIISFFFSLIVKLFRSGV